MQLTIIGRHQKPRCFKAAGRFPRTDATNCNAWITSALFTEFLTDPNCKMGSKNRRICLILDQCASHSKNAISQNVKLFFPSSKCAESLTAAGPQDANFQNVKPIFFPSSKCNEPLINAGHEHYLKGQVPFHLRPLGASSASKVGAEGRGAEPHMRHTSSLRVGSHVAHYNRQLFCEKRLWQAI